MASCFLAYSSGYKEIVQPIHRLLKSLEFEVESEIATDDEAQLPTDKITRSDCVLALYGPEKRPEANQAVTQAASRVKKEIQFAKAMNKPLALVRHLTTSLETSLESDHPDSPTFDFWNPASFMENVPQIVKTILDLKRRVDLPPGAAPYHYRKSSCRSILRSLDRPLEVVVFHEVVARQPCSLFHHQLDTGGDLTAQLLNFDPAKTELHASVNGEPREIELVPLKQTEREFEYNIRLKKPLSSGEVLSYYRKFYFKNHLPLTRAEMDERSVLTGYPKIFKKFGAYYYGDVWDVLYEMENISLGYEFPLSVKVGNIKACVIEFLSRAENKQESARCNNPNYLSVKDDLENNRRDIRLTVPKPIINHSYMLLYEPEEA